VDLLVYRPLEKVAEEVVEIRTVVNVKVCKMLFNGLDIYMTWKW